jgi:hypothetical protein
MKHFDSFYVAVSFRNSGSGQKTWWGEYSFYGGGGGNEIFRFEELLGAGSVTGTGFWTAGADMRRLVGDHFSFGTGLSYSHQYYYTSPAPGIPGEDRPGSFGLDGCACDGEGRFPEVVFCRCGGAVRLTGRTVGH